MLGQIGFFTEEIILEKLSALGDNMEKLNGVINWCLFSPYLKNALKKEPKGPGGRPPFPYILMFKILVLQRLYNLSDDQTEYQINDRMSFRRFLGLGLNDRIPDAKTIWLFRENLVKAEIIETLFQVFYQELEIKGLVAHEGSINDASFVEVPKRRKTKGENEHSNRQIDEDAAWTKKGDVSYFGYKNHPKVDAKSKIITDYRVTPANVHDSQRFAEFYNEFENDTAYGDSAYVGQELPENVEQEINERAYRNTPLTDEQKAENKRKSKIRARIEHVFGFVEMSMKGSTFRGKGVKRAEFNIGLTNLIYNMRRFEFFRRSGVCTA